MGIETEAEMLVRAKHGITLGKYIQTLGVLDHIKRVYGTYHQDVEDMIPTSWLARYKLYQRGMFVPNFNPHTSSVPSAAPQGGKKPPHIRKGVTLP